MPLKNFPGRLFLVALFILSLSRIVFSGELPAGFVYVEEAIPDIKVELRYYSTDNFVGERIDGYWQPRCILTKAAAQALKKAQVELKPFGLGLKIFDAYRPQQAVNHFVRWAKDLEDTRMKAKYYPNVEKKNLFAQGYLAEKSSHSRGSALDLTIIAVDSKNEGEELDMGTGFDLFDPKSWPQDRSLSPPQRAHRFLLQTMMKKHGFIPYREEWWHFTFGKEPFPNTYFDFPVQ